MKKGIHMAAKKREQVHTLVFRIFPEGMPSVWRVIELKEKQSLHDFHKIIYQAFGFQGKHLYTFYLSGKRWDLDTEYGGPSVTTPRKALKANLKKLKLEKGKTFLYLYNFIDEMWFVVEWVDDQETMPKTSYPRLLEKVGELPEQPQPIEERLPEPLKRLALKLKPVLETWVYARSKPRGPKDVHAANALVNDIKDMLKKRGSDIWPLLEEVSGMVLVDWLLSLPEDFVRRGLTEEAIKVCEDFSEFADKEFFLSEKALVYAYMGRRERALKQIRENLTLSPENPRIVTKAAEAFLKLDEAGHAERLLRKALDLAADDINERERVLQKLTVLLEENERTDEVAELIRSELDRV